MTTVNRTNEPTAEQILVDEWIRQADRAKSMTGMDAIWFPDAEETLAVLRTHGLLSEGAPSEEQIERAARAIRADYVQRYPEEPPVYHAGAGQPVWRHMARAALTAAGVAPQEPSGVTNANGHSWMTWEESGKNGTYCRSCGGWAGKVGNRQCSPAPVLPSSGVDEVRAEAVREVARYINRIAPNGLVPKKMILADMEFAADRLGRGIHANGNDRAVQGGESRGE